MLVVALSVLATALGKGEKSLQYLYQEHSVSLLVNVWYIVQWQRPTQSHTLPYQQLARLPNVSVVEHLFVYCHYKYNSCFIYPCLTPLSNAQLVTATALFWRVS